MRTQGLAAACVVADVGAAWLGLALALGLGLGLGLGLRVRVEVRVRVSFRERITVCDGSRSSHDDKHDCAIPQSAPRETAAPGGCRGGG